METPKHERERTSELIARFTAGVISGEMTIEEAERVIKQLRNLTDEALPCAVERLASLDEDTRAAAILLLLALNAPLYRFFARQRGLAFALQVIPWHWLYYLYSGLALAIGVARFLLGRVRSHSPNSPAGLADLSQPGEDT